MGTLRIPLTLSRSILPITTSSPSSFLLQKHDRRISPAMATAKPLSTDALKQGIAEFYDESSGLWENIWGDHMHHGYYDAGSTVSVEDHRIAQIRMIEQALRFASVSGLSLSLSVQHFFLVNIEFVWLQIEFGWFSVIRKSNTFFFVFFLPSLQFRN